MKNGFIYPFFVSVVNGLYYLNLVELFKYLARVYAKRKRETLSKEILIRNGNIAIDIYQIFKWGVLIFFWANRYDGVTSLVIIYYLLGSNLFTYFYYHVWGSKYFQRVDRTTFNRRFLNSIIAIAYYLFCYAYLYQFHYYEGISWPDGLVDAVNAIYLSVANAFTLTYGGFSPLTQEVRVVFMSELITTFLFLTIIISNSIPNHAGKE